jgi:KDO2-lipid IV(A) lauroyltransferase
LTISQHILHVPKARLYPFAHNARPTTTEDAEETDLAKRLHPALGVLAMTCELAIRLLPMRAASELMALTARGFSRLFTNKRKIRRNLHAAFPELDNSSLDDLTGKIIANCGRLIAEITKISDFRSGARGTALNAVGALTYPFEQRGKAIYVSAHLGNWELIPILFHRNGLPLTIIHTPIHHPGINDRLMSLRRETGATYVEKSKALRTCAAALKRGESIALLVDQRVDTGIEVQFFERPTVFTHFPARMALKFDCPIIVGEAVRLGPGRVEVVFHEPIWPNKQRVAQAERELTQKMAEMIEGCIYRHPEQWFCHKRRWKKSSTGGSTFGGYRDQDQNEREDPSNLVHKKFGVTAWGHLETFAVALSGVCNALVGRHSGPSVGNLTVGRPTRQAAQPMAHVHTLVERCFAVSTEKIGKSSIV